MRPLSLSSSTYDNLLLGELYRYIRVHDSSRSGGRRGQILVGDLWRYYPPGFIRLREYQYVVCMSITYFISLLDEKSYMKIFYPSTVHAKGAFTLNRDVGSLLD